MKWLVLLCVVFIEFVVSDIYLHNPRGSNNRLDEAKRPRNNANRLFDSQNNDRGGYNVGSLYYYQGSVLSIEWTNQHSCGAENAHCDIVIQYMCSDTLRDGASTQTIPVKQSQCVNGDCVQDLEYGMHEDYQYYARCLTRERNRGLFTADQLNPNTRGPAINTRQNPGGTRRGYECPEERDYYPYWHDSPWLDIAVLTNNASRCPFYQSQSQNVRSRFYCQVPLEVRQGSVFRRKLVPNNQADCESYEWTRGEESGYGKWTEVASHAIPAPECRETEFSRDNHLGNGIGGQPLMYNWTIPTNIAHEQCALRIRYNISTADYTQQDTSVTRTHGLTEAQGEQRGFKLENDPEVEIFPGLGVDFRLAVNTAQYGRTFQDRSHRFAIRPRPQNLNGVKIHNLNVRGKRGNIVQVYPAVEYDFVPTPLHLGQNEYVHFQWTGSNSNPGNNDGQGQAGSDRSNVVMLGEKVYPEGSVSSGVHGHWGRSYPSNLTTFMGLDMVDLTRLAFNRENQLGGELSELNDAGTYFDLGPRKVTQRGTYHFMCTRNNNFSNRSQKGKITSGSPVAAASIGWNGGSIQMSQDAGISVPQATFSSLKSVQILRWTPDETRDYVRSLGQELSIGDGLAGDVIVIHPEEELTESGKTFTVTVPAGQAGAFTTVGVYRTNTDSFVTWTKIDAQVGDGKADFQTSRGGVYAAFREKNLPLIVGVLIAVILVLAAVVGSVLYFRRHPAKLQAMKKSLSQAKLSTQDQI